MRTNCLFTSLKYKVVHFLGPVADVAVEADFWQILRLEACGVLTVVMLCLVRLLLCKRCVQVE